MARGDRFFFYATRQVYDQPQRHGIRYESLHFDTTDGSTLSGWYLPADPAAGGGPDAHSAIGTVVHCYGNAGTTPGTIASLCSG